jgi:hypothetical protein
MIYVRHYSPVSIAPLAIAAARLFEALERSTGSDISAA